MGISIGEVIGIIVMVLIFFPIWLFPLVLSDRKSKKKGGDKIRRGERK